MIGSHNEGLFTRRLAIGVLSLAIMTGLAACGKAPAPIAAVITRPVVNAKVEACIVRGVEYFKEIDSFPILHSEPNAGRHARDVARERCERTITAF